MRTYRAVYNAEGRLTLVESKGVPAPAWIEQDQRGFARLESLEQKRGEAMRGWFPKLAAWFRADRTADEAPEVYRELAQARDIADLEARMRRIDREQRSALTAGVPSAGYSI
jgi:hypothetical protein